MMSDTELWIGGTGGIAQALLNVMAAEADESMYAGGLMSDETLPKLEAAVLPFIRAAVEAERERCEALMDSLYLAGAKAGFNAAQADDQNAAMKSLHDSRQGYLAPIIAARAERSRG